MNLRYLFLGLALAVLGLVVTAGLRGHHFTSPPFEIFPDMNYQDKVKDQQPSNFFADGNSARLPIAGTVAMEMPALNDYWATGKWDDSHWGNGIPAHEARDGGRALAIDDENMARGRERYTISCAVCHGASGDGQGVVTKYGLTGVAGYHTDRLRQTSDGDIFNTISNGKGQMLGYGYNITIDDRWRIVMYVRALQRSEYAPYSDATSDEQAALEKTKKPATPPPAPAPAPAASSNKPPPPPVPEDKPGSTQTSPTATPAPPPTNAAPAAKPAGAATNAIFHDPYAYALSERLIDDHGFSIVGPTYFQKFAPSTNKTKQGSPSHSSDYSTNLRPVVLVTQTTMKGWYDSNEDF